MIIGRDILTGLGIDIKFSTNTVSWEGHEVPMKDTNATEQQAYHVEEPDAVDQATERIKGILDAKYEAADLDKVAEDAAYLDVDERKKLHTLLNKYETLFDGTLGNWKDVEYNIDLKPDVEPYHARAYPTHV